MARMALQLDRPADATQACRTALLEDSLDEDVVELLLTSYLVREQRVAGVEDVRGLPPAARAAPAAVAPVGPVGTEKLVERALA